MDNYTELSPNVIKFLYALDKLKIYDSEFLNLLEMYDELTEEEMEQIYVNAFVNGRISFKALVLPETLK